MAKSINEIAKKWSRNLAGSTDSIRAGVQAVTESPTEKAARRQDAYIDGVQRAVQDGKWQRGLRRVSNEQWKEATLTKGLPRIAAGAAAAQGKMESFMAEWMPHEEALQRKLESMPRGTLEQNKARALAAIDHNANFRRRNN